MTPHHRFTRGALERIADNAATTHDAKMLRQHQEFERQFNTYADPKERILEERRLARALGREAMAEVFFHESAERLTNFRDRKEVQPLLIETPDGRLITHRFKDTQPQSLLERIARPLAETRVERELRVAMESALHHQQHTLASDLEKSKIYYDAARKISGSLRKGETMEDLRVFQHQSSRRKSK